MPVGLAGLIDAGRVIVRQDHSGGVEMQRGLDDLTRIDGGAVNRAAKHFFEGNQPMLVIQVHDAEGLMLQPGKVKSQVFTGIGGRLNGALGFAHAGLKDGDGFGDNVIVSHVGRFRLG